jgi:tetratricopeptide (TPR) repeat protein
LSTEAGYHSFGPAPSLDKTIAAYEALIERDSLNGPALNNAGLRYAAKRDLVRAEQMLRRATALEGAFGGSFTNLADVQVEQGKFAAAESTGVAFRTTLPSHAGHWVVDGSIAIGRQDFSRLDSVAAAAYQDPKAQSSRDFISLLRGQIASVHGQIRKAMQFVGEAEALTAAISDTKMPVLRASLDSAWMRAFFLGENAQAREQVRKALAAVPMESLPASERQWQFLIHIAQASGDVAGARAALASFERDLPQMGVQQSAGELAEARGQVALAEGRAADAIPLFREADRTYASCRRCAMIRLARAFDLAGQRDSAIHYFQQFVTTPATDLFQDQDWLAGSYKRLGELYEAAGDLPKAATNLEKFVELWKNADPELQPKVREARDRLTRIRAELARRG